MPVLQPSLAGASPRRGVILLVVLMLLTMFAVIGLALVYYSDSRASAARSFREAQQVQRYPGQSPDQVFNLFLSQFLYDDRDDAPGVYSALRGHSLYRGMYGLNYQANPDGTLSLANNTVAYNGTGRLHAPSLFAANPAAPPEAQDEYNLVNYSYFPGDGFLRDPERPGARANLADTRRPFVGGFNASYTYPDLNNMFLAAVRADGTVLVPSFHRPWAGFGPLDPGNPNWTDTTQPWLKYMVLRPRPADNPPLNGQPGFALPGDAGGDVKNLTNGPGGNDSIWIDLGAPVQTAPDGHTRYKALFAPLIVDLDGKVNVNVHGNVRGGGRGHVSNQGWGPWEVAVNRVLTADPTEWQNLYAGVPGSGGSPSRLGRYGPDQQPTPPAPATLAVFGPQPHFYGRVDFDACLASGTSTNPIQLPAGTTCFPSFPPGYDDAGVGERTNHPALCNVLGTPGHNGAAYDLAFDVSNLASLWCSNDGLGYPGCSNDLATLCGRNFADPRTRRLVTTTSFDVDVPGVTPWVAGNGGYGATLRTANYPSVPERLVGGGAKPFPTSFGSSTSGEFGPDGRAADAALGRVDVNRPLPDYPVANPMSGLMTDIAGFQKAQGARQDLARDIFVRLVKVTGAYDPSAYQSPTSPSNPTPPSATEVNTLRWLAQLAVNMVDFIDSDDLMTPFNWGKTTGTPAFTALEGNEWVFGTELPHVLLNETYAEFLNVPGETGSGRRATTYVVNVWLELFDPFVADPTLPNGGEAQLDRAYQVVLSKPNANLLSGTDMANVLGDPDNTGPNQVYDPTRVYTAFSNFAPTRISTADSPGQGFYVIGPAAPVPGVQPGIPSITPTLSRAEMSYQVPVAPGSVVSPPDLTILLRRLACPTLPYQPDPSVALYNPYVTVDSRTGTNLVRGITNNGAGFPNNPMSVAGRVSEGRVQPYAAAGIAPQTPPPLVNQPQHTFFQHNAPRLAAFDWLVHPDRPLVSPMELLHVSCCKPHQLTQMFQSSTPDSYLPFNHSASWALRDDSSPLYRVFELLETGPRAGGVTAGGRVPGKINLNTIWDPETFAALCDPQPGNFFTAADVAQVYQWMLAGRSPDGAPGANDRPFASLGNGYFTPSGNLYATNRGLNDTILRDNPAHPLYDASRRPVRLFEVIHQDLRNGAIVDHPYQRYEMLQKIFGNVTTRSNVFAVWVTVGFFEVNDESSQPVKLGAEFVSPDGHPVRYRMFAIVDRSNPLQVFPGQGEAAVTAATPVVGAGPATITPTRMGTTGAVSWNIQPGALLRVTGADSSGVVVSEAVVVTAVTPATFTATFTRAYPQGFTAITANGHPGPGSNPQTNGSPVALVLRLP